MDSEYLTLEEAARELRVNLDTMRRYVREGRIQAGKVGKRYMVRRKDVRDYIEKSFKPVARKRKRTT